MVHSMTRFILLAILALSFGSPVLAQGNADCRAIAAATVAELRAGYAQWSDEAENLARAAAGAACVKASTASQSAGRDASISSAAVRADGVVVPEAAAATADSAVAVDGATSQSVAATDSTDEKAEKEEESWNPFSDIKFNKVSARPNRKPYERKRHSLDDDED